jgi:histidinol dehydrogenase
MARKKSAVDKATERLAKELAKEHFEYALEMYEDSAADLADDGVTERSYVTDCDDTDEVIAVYDSLAEEIVDLATEEYARLVRAKYKRIK